MPENPGYRISELPHRVARGEVRAAYIMGEDPLQTDAELSAVRQAFEDLELVIVQDIFMTKNRRGGRCDSALNLMGRA
ncbi:formate dehydrogenase-H [Klebsiella grimontii]|uniref:Formate dehydrogenase-H n=1 Tax=Klebsiella grimontii TaxID=2058152 RepID=A0A7H4P1R3_9ENTR|nr:formate dehydrogenase-H [Klebsiella grimontii]